MTFGPMELMLGVIVALLVFGPGKLPDLGKGLGQGLREFRAVTRDLRRDLDLSAAPQDERG